jgi:methylenetetrahydrofolate reductase (NADPH)
MGQASRETVLEFLRRARYEVIPLEGVEDEVVEHVPKDVKLTVTASPRKGIDSTLGLSEALAKRGFQVVPHISARLVVDEAHLADILQRLDALGLREVFVIAGDVSEPAGKFTGASALLSAMAELGHGLEEIGITGYPESHPVISDEDTIQAMYEKAPFATYIVSQICFDTQIIGWWIGVVRKRGVELPIYIGMPGVAQKTKLFRISTKIGLGESARFLRKHGTLFARLFLPGPFSPDRLIEGLGPTLGDPEGKVRGFHIYTFNEVKKTEEWRREAIDRLGSE